MWQKKNQQELREGEGVAEIQPLRSGARAGAVDVVVFMENGKDGLEAVVKLPRKMHLCFCEGQTN